MNARRRLILFLIGLLCCSIHQPAWTADEAWAQRAEEYHEKTWWMDFPVLLAMEAYFLGAFKADGHLGDRIIDSDAVTYSAVGLAALSLAMPLMLPKETRVEGREIRKNTEKGFWKKCKEDLKRLRLLQSRVEVPRSLKGAFYVQPIGLGIGTSRPAELVDVAAERINAANITLHSALDADIQHFETFLGMRYGLFGDVLTGVDVGVSDANIDFSRITGPDGSVLGRMRYRVRTLYIDPVLEWRTPIRWGKLNFFIGAGPSYYHTVFTETLSWRSSTTWDGAALGGKIGIRADWYVLRHSNISFGITRRFGRINRIRTESGEILRNSLGTVVPIDLAGINFSAGINHRF